MDDHTPFDLESYLLVVRRSADPEWPLEGEDPTTSSRDTAAYWADLYGRLVVLEEESLAAIREVIARSSQAVRAEAERSNVPLLQGQIDKFRRRFQFWMRRQSEFET